MGFFEWYDTKVVHSLLITAIILYLQIPHTIFAFECTLNQHLFLYSENVITNFILYSIDMLEMIPIVAVTLSIISKVKVRLKKKN